MYRWLLQLYERERGLTIALALFLLAKLALLHFFPLTGDEAYELNLGLDPRWAYYDHPQAHPWIVYLLSWVSDSYIWMRWVGVAMIMGSGVAIYRIGRLLGFTTEQCSLVLLICMFSTASAASVIFINDVTILLFLTWATYFLIRFIRDNDTRSLAIYAALSGIAFLVKYTAALVIIPGLIAVLIVRRKGYIRFLLTFSLFFLPFVILNLVTNYYNCWANISFNLFNRMGRARPDKIFDSLILIVMVLNPLLLYFYFKGERLLSRQQSWMPIWALRVIVVLPFLLLLVASLRKEIFPIWLIDFSFLVFLFLLPLGVSSLRKVAVISAIYGAVVLALLGSAVVFQDKITVPRYMIFLHPQAFCDEFSRHAAGYAKGATYYDEAAVLNYSCGDTATFFMNYKNGRDDDFRVDYSQFDGKNVALLLHGDHYNGKRMSLDKLKSFFRESDIYPFKVRGHQFQLLRGRGFNYEKYQTEFLIPMFEQNVTKPLPTWFPASKCPLAQHYALDITEKD